MLAKRMMDVKRWINIIKLNNKSIASMISLFLCLIFLFHDTGITHAANSKQYLVLIQQKNGTWKRYENLVETSDGGSLMVKAKLLSKALGFTYKKNSGGFVIKRGASRYLTFTRDSKEYLYTDGASYTTGTAPEKAYTSKLSSYNLCQVSTLSCLVNYKYYGSTKTMGYEGYRGILMFSKYNTIPATVPVSEPIPTKMPTPTPVPEPAVIIIEGVEFPVRDNFLAVKDTLSDWGGASVNWRKLELELDQKILASTDLVVENNRIGFSHLVKDSDGVYLEKTGKGYKITLSVKLTGSVLTEQNAEVLKAMITTISAKPTLVYQAIFDSFTSGDTHGIMEDSYTVIGDCKIKVMIKDGEVTYYILEA